MRTPDANRQRRLVEYRSLEGVREQHAMQYQRRVHSQWKSTGHRLGDLLGRDPQTLLMFSDDTARHISEERSLIYTAQHCLADKDLGIWEPIARIGDIYAQRIVSRFKNFETVRDPEYRTGVKGERPGTFFESKYYKKRVKQLRSFIEKVRPFDPNADGLIVVGTSLELSQFSALPKKVTEVFEPVEEETVVPVEKVSVIKVAISQKRLFFRTAPGQTQSRSVTVSNEGTASIYYKWETAREVELTLRQGAERTTVRNPELTDPFDWEASESFQVPKNIGPRTRSEFCFVQETGSIRPGCRAVFDFSFKSAVTGCFIQRWIMRITPLQKDHRPLSVSLRGCCESEPPNLSSFKKSINNSLHESERARCVSEILGSVFERVTRVCALRGQPCRERIDVEVLIDDRAPIFEAANRKWSLTYAPGLYQSLVCVAEDLWDAADTSPFDRFWDMSVDSLTAEIMTLPDGRAKRSLLRRVNEILRRNMTVGTAGDLTFSLAYVHIRAYLEHLQDHFEKEAEAIHAELPLFQVPKPPDPAEIEEAIESARRGKKKPLKPPPPPPPKKPRKGKAPPEPPPPEPVREISPDLRARIRVVIKDRLRERLLAFESVAGEGTAVAQQLTRVNEIEKLDTNLAAEVEDEL
jgi:hypothetical protein